MNINELGLNKQIMDAVAELRYTELTPIQEKTMPLLLAGKDVIGQSATGSGKTAAYGLPILQQLTPGAGLQALILTPTRELCVQVTDAMSQFGRHMRVRVASVYGGVSLDPQTHAIRTADIVVGTPGRILDHMERGNLAYPKVKFLVLDEADKMFEMGFIDDVERIISQIPKPRQTMLFSATMPFGVRELAKKHMQSPVTIRHNPYVDKSLMKQVYYDLNSYEKFSLLVHLLKTDTPGLALVFCATRHEVDVVERNLRQQDIQVMAIHGGLTQNRRLQALDALRTAHINVLVATDVAARGLDIQGVSHVYNYDSPKSSEEYLHRIGRTARAGMEGKAVTLLCDKDHENFRNVLRDSEIQVTKELPPEHPKLPFQRPERRGFSRREDQGRGFRGQRSSHAPQRPGARNKYHSSHSSHTN